MGKTDFRKPSKATISFFRENLYEWSIANPRPMPWKEEKDPYLIWLSEIILQQTRVAQGRPYFENFKKAFPSIHDLAGAPLDEVMKLWEGLGYYSRARNLHHTAKKIAFEMNGSFPETFEGLKALKGVGDYTASAIASFAFNLPNAVVDGNVYRILSRFFGIKKATDSTEGKKEFKFLAGAMIDQLNPAKYNQAIMDFGALQCIPSQPDCVGCPMAQKCSAFLEKTVNELPVKEKKLKKKKRFFNFLILRKGELVLIEKRTGNDIWKNLYQFPLIESENLIETRNEMISNNIYKELLGSGQADLVGHSALLKHTLTHQTILARFWEIRLKSVSVVELKGHMFIESKKLGNFAFPKLIGRYLQDNILALSP